MWLVQISRFMSRRQEEGSSSGKKEGLPLGLRQTQVQVLAEPLNNWVSLATG